MFILLGITQIFGLILVVGGPFFYQSIWHFACSDDSVITKLVQRRISLLVLIGAGLCVVSGTISIFQEIQQSPELFVSINYETFFVESNSGFTLLSLTFSLVFITGFFRKLNWQSMAMIGLITLWTISATTHAAEEPGFLPFFSNWIHLVAFILWGGSLIYFIVVPWRQISQLPERYGMPFWEVLNRFTNLTILLLGITLVTGVLLTFVHVHSSVAMESTQYGQALKIKITLVAVLVIMIFINILKFVPSLRRSLRDQDPLVFSKSLMRFRTVIFIEVTMLTAILIMSAVMKTHEPPDTAPFLNPLSWSMNAGDIPLRVEMRPVVGSANNVRFEIFLPENMNIDAVTRTVFNLYMPDSEIGTYGNEAVQVSMNSYLGEGAFTMPGSWKFEIELLRSDNIVLNGSYQIDLPGQPLQEDLRTYLSPHAIGYTVINTINFIVGILLIFTFCWLIWLSRVDTAPVWSVVAGAVGVAVGFYMIFSVMLVKTYPSTFWKNPVPYTAVNIMQGQKSFLAQCAECHGLTGKGDGQWSLDQKRTLLDLASPHIDVHTDGEMFWWITHGIPSFDMPPLDKDLTEVQRWQVINYIRSLRHGVPGE